MRTRLTLNAEQEAELAPIRAAAAAGGATILGELRRLPFDAKDGPSCALYLDLTTTLPHIADSMRDAYQKALAKGPPKPKRASRG